MAVLNQPGNEIIQQGSGFWHKKSRHKDGLNHTLNTLAPCTGYAVLLLFQQTFLALKIRVQGFDHAAVMFGYAVTFDFQGRRHQAVFCGPGNEIGVDVAN